MTQKIGFLIFMSGVGFQALAQEKVNTKADSVTVTTDTTLVDGHRPVENIVSYANRFNPRKALLYSAVFPGSGQVYNKKYWKVPLVYGGLGLLINAVSYYEKAYVRYKNELFITINGGAAPSGASQATLRAIVDQARRQRDYFLIITGLVYVLQIVDAHVDAHLKEFDLNPKLHVKMEPRFEQNLMMGRSTGFSLRLRF
jgi:hypothetical protein